MNIGLCELFRKEKNKNREEAIGKVRIIVQLKILAVS
jgi:hypothetical protein